MVPVQLVHLVPSHLGCSDKALVHQAGYAATDPDLRATGRLLGDLPNRQGVSYPGQHREYRSIEGRRQRPGGIGQVHDHLV